MEARTTERTRWSAGIVTLASAVGAALTLMSIGIHLSRSLPPGDQAAGFMMSLYVSSFVGAAIVFVRSACSSFARRVVFALVFLALSLPSLLAYAWLYPILVLGDGP